MTASLDFSVPDGAAHAVVTLRNGLGHHLTGRLSQKDAVTFARLVMGRLDPAGLSEPGATSLADGALQVRFGIPKGASRVLAALYRAYPRPLGREELHKALGSTADVKIIDVYVCKLRAVFGLAALRTIYRSGYLLSEALHDEIRVVLHGDSAVSA